MLGEPVKLITVKQHQISSITYIIGNSIMKSAINY